MVFRLSRWNLGEPAFEVRDGSSREIRGRISTAFKSFLDLMAGQIEEQEVRQDEIDTELQQTVERLRDTVEILEEVTGTLQTYTPLVDQHDLQISTILSRLADAGIP